MSPAAAKQKRGPSEAREQIERAARILGEYAERGVFRGFSRGPVRTSQAAFRIVWHRDRVFDLTLDCKAGSLRFAEILPGVPADSAMYRELKAFLRLQQSSARPEHRRIDSDKALVRLNNRRGSVALALTIKDGDYEYGVRKCIHLVHEIFMSFLVDGAYLEYIVETFGVDPDRM
jgi:hypothetical protein